MSKSSIVLEIKELRYFSPFDEDAFFAWLDRISCVQETEGIRSSLFVTVDPELVNQETLRELLALFFRYGVEMKQLSALENDQFSSWFRNKEAFWYSQIFGLD